MIGALEHAGHDPMGFTRRSGEDWQKPALSAAARKRALRTPGGAVASHLGQAETLGAVGAGALGLSALYHRRAKVAKADRATKERRKSAILAGTTGAVGAAGVHLGARNYTSLAEQVCGAGLATRRRRTGRSGRSDMPRSPSTTRPRAPTTGPPRSLRPALVA